MKRNSCLELSRTGHGMWGNSMPDSGDADTCWPKVEEAVQSGKEITTEAQGTRRCDCGA